MDVIKVGLLAIAGIMLAVQFKGQKQEYGLYIGFAISLMVFTFSIGRLEAVMVQVNNLKNLLGNQSEYLAILLKVIGITYVCEFCAGICKDSGYSSVASQIEIFGKLTVLLSGMPVLLALIETIQNFSG